MIIKLDRWELKRFFHWWMCKRNPDKEFEWLQIYEQATAESKWHSWYLQTIHEADTAW